MTEPAAGSQNQDAVARLESRLHDDLGDLMPRGTRAALINFPNHHNVGDSALYLGTMRALRELAVRVTYRCEQRTYSREALARELGRGTEIILINGGGNLGDVYPQQEIRERVLTDFPDVRTIQLPQSVWFTDLARRERFGDLVSRHSDLTLLLRDDESLQAAEQHLHGRARLSPDLSFGLGRLARPAAPTTPVVWLRRTDREATPMQIVPSQYPDVPGPVDWLMAKPREAVGGAFGGALLEINTRLTPRVPGRSWLWRPLSRTFEPLAARRLAFGCRMLATGRVVVTDRLHGMILALQMGIPVVAVDNANHKVGAFYRTWLQGVPGVHLAPDHADALEIARTIV